jgi:predicted RNA-binding Zn-ribbon protein involved in translation (DUF1610 family)
MGSYYRRSRKTKDGTIVHYHSAKNPKTFADAWYGAQAQADNEMESLRIAGRLIATAFRFIVPVVVLLFLGIAWVATWVIDKFRSDNSPARDAFETARPIQPAPPIQVRVDDIFDCDDDIVQFHCPSCREVVIHLDYTTKLLLNCPHCNEDLSLHA